MDQIMWIIKGEILNLEIFNNCAEHCVTSCNADSDTKICWWTHSATENKYALLCYFNNEACAMRCLNMWANMAEQMTSSMTFQKCIVLGDPSGQLLDAMQHLNPKALPFVCGFERDEPISVEHRDVFTVVKGKITDLANYKEAMERLVTSTKDENGAFMQHCFVSEETKKFCIVERYMDHEAAKAHHRTWDAIYPEFSKCAQISKIVILNGQSTEDIAANTNTTPHHMVMEFTCGFAR